MLGYGSVGVRVAGAALELARVALGIEGIAYHFKGQFAALEGLLYEYRDCHRHVHAHTLEKTLAVGLELVVYAETNL